jgi:hypothetical protein
LHCPVIYQHFGFYKEAGKDKVMRGGKIQINRGGGKRNGTRVRKVAMKNKPKILSHGCANQPRALLIGTPTAWIDAGLLHHRRGDFGRKGP